MPAAVQNRFRALHVFSDERSKINDLFEQEVRELSEASKLLITLRAVSTWATSAGGPLAARKSLEDENLG